MEPTRRITTKYKGKIINKSKIEQKPIALVIDNVRKGFRGEAERLGLNNEEDVVEMIKQIREERQNKVACE